jgi:hypothetical protein
MARRVILNLDQSGSLEGSLRQGWMNVLKLRAVHFFFQSISLLCRRAESRRRQTKRRLDSARPLKNAQKSREQGEGTRGGGRGKILTERGTLTSSSAVHGPLTYPSSLGDAYSLDSHHLTT